MSHSGGLGLVDAVLEETGARERRVRLLPARVVVYFALALAFFERASYTAVWAKLATGLGSVTVASPCASSLARARRRLGSGPLRRLFEVLAGPVACRGEGCAFYRGLRLVALVECGTRAVLAASFGPDSTGELAYARRLLPHLDASMLLLADAYNDAFDFLQAVAHTRAHLVLRSTRKRRPTQRTPLTDGSCLTGIRRREYRPGHGYDRLPIRVIEAWVTVTLADGSRRTELWRLLTNLVDAEHYPAAELLEIYHRRWQAETCYFSLKSTILDGRVLRSRSVPGIEQEVFALLTAYQALIRTAGDLTTARPGLSAQRISFTVLLQAAADQIVAARGITTAKPVSLIGVIGRRALDNLLPEHHRQRLKARYRKSASKYDFKRGDHPRTTQAYTLTIEMIKNGVLDRPATG